MQDESTTSSRTSLRLWPGFLIVGVQWFARFVLPAVVPGDTVGMAGVMTAAIAGPVLVLWWLLLSRAPWSQRLGGAALMVAGLAAAVPALHESMATAGQGFVYFIYAIPGVCLAFVAWAALSQRWSRGAQWLSMAAAIFVACFGWALVRTYGVTGGFDSDFAWRWAQTPEEQLLAQSSGRASRTATVVGEAEWPGFRGPMRDGHVPGLRIATDWDASPPQEEWRRAVGPGWSSFAVGGGYFYTQEQRGENEVVACYDLATGEPVWMHEDPVRFWESNAGAGPRATPTLMDGRVYALGATGILNALDARDGAVVWSRDVVADTGAVIPGWGFSSSPLVVEGHVLVAAAGQLAAYDSSTGALAWKGEKGSGYSSPHLLTLADQPQVVLLSSHGAQGVLPADGRVLWQHEWGGEPIVQPAITPNGDVLVTTVEVSGGAGMRRLAIDRSGDSWSFEERWMTNRLKPYFSDFVVHEGHAYGFDGSIMACIDLEDGQRKWKGGRYGHGQLVLLPDQDVMLVLSEQGDLVLVSATPDEHREIAKVSGIEGKTWNHPVLVRDRLLVRNAEEMASFRLQLADT